ncbi:MAG: hypothetical protein AAGI91_15930 [Bacteroidota bacterium]
MPRFLCFFVAVLLLSAPAAAQSTYLGLSVEGGVPFDDFEEQLDDVGIGVSGQVLFHAGVVPVAVGLDGGVLTYGQQAQPLPAQIDGQSAFLGEVETTNRISHLYGVLRLVPNGGAVRPYIDALGGFNYFRTRVRSEQEVFLVDGGDLLDLGSDAVVGRNVTSSTVLDDFALSYGAGAGLLIRLADGDDNGTPFEAFLEVGARYLFGEQARYVLDGVPTEDGRVGVIRESETNLLRPQLGLVIQFGK